MRLAITKAVSCCRRVSLQVVCSALAVLLSSVGAQAAIDGLQYIASYPDLIRALGANAAAGQQHYLQFGQAEGRSPDSFNETQYVANYRDLRAAFGTNGNAATIHYIQNGFREGRTDKLNIVVILADDLGYGEVGAFHVGDVATPNIDAIARAGVTFTDGYVTASQCVPSRAGLLTGRYSQEFGFYRNPQRPYPANFTLPPSEITLGEALRARGYATGMVGKWHLGMKAEAHPLLHGFDEFFGVLDTDHPYFGETSGNPILRGNTPVPASGYLTDTLAAEAASFIRRRAGQPFFLYVPFTAIHTPLQAKPDVLARLGYIQDPKRRLVAAVLASLDEGVGRILAELQATGIADRTAVVFMGDNGCTNCQRFPLRGGKGTFWEGGIRVPYILSWPGQVVAGQRYGQPVMSTDLFATFLRAAGGTPPSGADGVDLLPFLRGAGGTPHPYLFWGGKTNGATRGGDWKLVGNELYNVRSDLGETRNVASTNPAVVANLRQARAIWLRTLKPALW